jgi:hypothetical protein
VTESIHALFQRVTEHPDFAGGTIFTRADVADALFMPDDGWGGWSTSVPDEASIARVTEDMLIDAAEIIDDYIFGGPYSWREALRDNIDTP